MSAGECPSEMALPDSDDEILAADGGGGSSAIGCSDRAASVACVTEAKAAPKSDSAHVQPAGSRSSILFSDNLIFIFIVICGAIFLGEYSPETNIQVTLPLTIDLRAAVLLIAVLPRLANWLPQVSASASKTDPTKPAEKTTHADGAVATREVSIDPEEVFTDDQEVQTDAAKECTLPKDVLQQLMEWNSDPKVYEEKRQKAEEQKTLDKLYFDMASASPALVHRFPAGFMDRCDSHWSTPMFSAQGYLWSIRMGPLSKNDKSSRYFCILPQGHTERLRCSFVFAKHSGEGYQERRVHDWPANLNGHPWGPTIPEEELLRYVQADGTLFLMVHAVGLGSEEDDAKHGKERKDNK